MVDMKKSVYKSYDELPLLLNSKIGAPAKPRRRRNSFPLSI